MRADIEQHVDTNSAADTKNSQAGSESGQELKDEVEHIEPVSESGVKEPSLPLFMSDRSEGEKGNPQDEKDETEE